MFNDLMDEGVIVVFRVVMMKIWVMRNEVVVVKYVVVVLRMFMGVI